MYKLHDNDTGHCLGKLQLCHGIKLMKKPKGVRVGSPFMYELYDDSTGHGLEKLQSFHWRKNSEKGI